MGNSSVGTQFASVPFQLLNTVLITLTMPPDCGDGQRRPVIRYQLDEKWAMAYLISFCVCPLSSVPKLHVRDLFGRVRPRTWRFEDLLDWTLPEALAKGLSLAKKPAKSCLPTKNYPFRKSPDVKTRASILSI
jgi:hypothetical protein